MKIDVADVHLENPPPLVIVGCGPSFDLYDLDVELIGCDVFAINAAITECWPIDLVGGRLWWWVHDLNRIFRYRLGQRLSKRLRGWSNPQIATWAAYRDLSLVGNHGSIVGGSQLWTYERPDYDRLTTNTFHRAVSTAIMWGYTDIRLIGVDMAVVHYPRTSPEQIYGDLTRYYAKAFLWKPRPRSMLKRYKNNAIDAAPIWLDRARIVLGRHSLWRESPRCPFEVETTRDGGPTRSRLSV